MTVEEELALQRAENQHLRAEKQELLRQTAELQGLNAELMAELTKGGGSGQLPLPSPGY